MRLLFTPHGWADSTYWLNADRQTLKRINRPLNDGLVVLQARFHYN